MRRQLVLAVALFTTALTLPVENVAGTGARANLHQINGSKVKAKFVLMDTGSQVVVSGVARGLEPSQGYITLAYDSASVPAGPNACRPTVGAPGFVGQWTVNADGSGTLAGVLPPGSLGFIGTISVRIASTMALQACGDVSTGE